MWFMDINWNDYLQKYRLIDINSNDEGITFIYTECHVSIFITTQNK